MLSRIGIAVILVGTISPINICQAKPADLPGDIFQQCPQARDGQQLDGSPQRPDAAEALPPRTAPMREFDRLPVRDAGNVEEQEAPPARFNYREPTERRDTNTTPGWRSRDPHRQSSEDERRQEMLRSTEQLDTLQERPIVNSEQVVDDEVMQIGEVPLPAVVFSSRAVGDGHSQKDDEDELSWLPASTRDK